MNKQLKALLIKFPWLYRKLKAWRDKKYGRDGMNPSLPFLLQNIGKDKLVLEIGTFTGQSTKYLAEDNFVVGIDPFLPNTDNGTLYEEYTEDVYNMLMKNTLGKKVMLLPMTSKKAFTFWYEFIQREFDFIFVDGWHTYEGAEIDFQWTKYLKIGGNIAFHDVELECISTFIGDFILGNSCFEFINEDIQKTGEHTMIFRRVK